MSDGFLRSAKGARVRSRLGVFVRAPRPRIPQDTVFICGAFSGGVAMYNPYNDEWIPLGLPATWKIILHKGELYASPLSGGIKVARFLGIDNWENVGTGLSGAPSSFSSDGINLYCDDEGTGGIYLLDEIAEEWNRIGSETVAAPVTFSGQLWSAGPRKWDGTNWIEKSDWTFESGAGSPTFNYVEPDNGQWHLHLRGGGNFGAGFYLFSDENDQWEFAGIPTKHNLAGSTTVDGYVYTGNGSTGWELNPTDDLGTDITVPANIRNLRHLGSELYIITNNLLYKGTIPELDSTIPLSTVNKGISYKNKLIIAGDDLSNGRVQQYQSGSYSPLGADTSFPDDEVYDITAGSLISIYTQPTSSSLAMSSTDSTSITLIIESIEPSTGPEEGGTFVTITGMGFTTSTTVEFDGNTASDIEFVSSTILTCDTPPGSGLVDVTVIDGTDTVTQEEAFAYEGRP